MENDLWGISVIEADDDAFIVLYSSRDLTPKMYIAVGVNAKPLTFSEIMRNLAVGTLIGGVAGAVFKPIGPILSPIVGAAAGLGLGYGAGAVMMYQPLHSCPVCGSEVADKPLGEDVRCEGCGFVSTWTR